VQNNSDKAWIRRIGKESEKGHITCGNSFLCGFHGRERGRTVGQGHKSKGTSLDPSLLTQ